MAGNEEKALRWFKIGPEEAKEKDIKPETAEIVACQMNLATRGAEVIKRQNEIGRDAIMLIARAGGLVRSRRWSEEPSIYYVTGVSWNGYDERPHFVGVDVKLVDAEDRELRRKWAFAPIDTVEILSSKGPTPEWQRRELNMAYTKCLNALDHSAHVETWDRFKNDEYRDAWHENHQRDRERTAPRREARRPLPPLQGDRRALGRRLGLRSRNRVNRGASAPPPNTGGTTMTRKTELLHVGVTKARKGPGYLITAEYVEGYKVLAHYKTAEAAEAALPRVVEFYGPELETWKVGATW